MKRILIAIMATMMLVGCSSNSTEETESDTTTTTTEEKGYVFEYNDIEIEMNEDTSLFLEDLGEELSYFEAESCAFEGIDKTYTYAGFQLITYPTDDEDYVSSIVLKDDTVSTSEGICIGDEKASVEETYGTDYEEDNGAYVYTKGDSTLQFIFEDDYVTAITYTAITE
ncbi:MAG: hypothetical protein LUH02_05435 [Erysipelotrichaceae bacterium]|nr:hypothetical protein [Erysipelotrichaceae bacterium]